MQSPTTAASTATIAAPMTRLQAIVLLRRTLKGLLGHVPNPEMRLAAGKALQETSHVLATVQPSMFGWAVRDAGNTEGAWGLSRDAAYVHQCSQARGEDGQPLFEIIGLSSIPHPNLPEPSAEAEALPETT